MEHKIIEDKHKRDFNIYFNNTCMTIQLQQSTFPCLAYNV